MVLTEYFSLLTFTLAASSICTDGPSGSRPSLPYASMFRPGGQTSQVQQFMPPPAAQQFHPAGQAQNLGMPPGQSQPPPFSQPMPQFLPRPAQPGHAAPSSYPQQSMPISSGMPQPTPPGHGVSFSSSYTYAPSSFGLPQSGISMPSQFQPSSQMSTPIAPTGAQPWLQSSQSTPVVAPLQQASQQIFATSATAPAVNGSGVHNSLLLIGKNMKLLMGERADASTVWKEFTTPEGRKYYYNKETKQSKWTIPDELKLAREQAEKAAAEGAHSEMNTSSTVPTTASGTSVEQLSATVNLASSTTSTVAGVTSIPAPVAPWEVASSPSEVPGSSGVPIMLPSANSTPVTSLEIPPLHAGASPLGGASIQDIEEAKRGIAVAGKINVIQVEEKTTDDEPIIYATKQEQNAFKALLESANVEADGLGTSKAVTMFEDDKRFKAVELETDREDLFRNYLVDLQKKSETGCTSVYMIFRWSILELIKYLDSLVERAKAQEEYRRNRLEFREFLESCGFIKVDSQWRKVQDQLEDDERCTRLDKLDRLEIFQDYIRDLEKEEDEQKKRQKEQLRRVERKNRDAFRKMMEEHIAAGTLTAKTHWRDYCHKVKDSEAYEAVASNTSGSTPRICLRMLQKSWRERQSTHKGCFEAGKGCKFWIAAVISKDSVDVKLQLVYEDLIDRAKEKEEKEAKKRKRLAKDLTDKLSTIKEINALSTWEECKSLLRTAQSTGEEFFLNWREYMHSEVSIGEENLCREIFDEYVSRLQEKVKEKERKREEEKAKKEKEREEKEKRKDKERREKEKDKERDKDRDREREKEKGKDHSRKDEEIDDVDGEESHGHKDEKRREKDKERKHRKRHQSTTDDVSSDKDDKEETKKSRKHGSDRKKSRKHAYSPESDSESRHKKHKKDRDGSRRSGGHEELEDGELGEDGRSNS
ncbi:UNVERIFIED_CONTAM: Pre-processing protein 40A [Sesamum calycinum]|uniref:Pre-processing protein 40A n=1 Tax=Sesamum calycinum TaxID=2727403 RepID=A0AAW2QMZ5_9LAMI